MGAGGRLAGGRPGSIRDNRAACVAARLLHDLPCDHRLPEVACTREGLIIGSAELAFQLGYADNLVDDPRLGFRSGGRPNFIVIDKNRYAEWIPQYEQREPETYRYIRGMLDGEFHQVLENDGYRCMRATDCSNSRRRSACLTGSCADRRYRRYC